MTLREAIPDDVPALAALYADVVRTAGPEHYTPAQVEAWAGFADEPAFRRFVLGAHTLVAEDETGPVAFAGLEKRGRIASLYVRHDRLGRGLGGKLLRALVDHGDAEGMTRLWAEASTFSLPVFERYGFVLEETEVVERRGTEFERFIVVRST